MFTCFDGGKSKMSFRMWLRCMGEIGPMDLSISKILTTVLLSIKYECIFSMEIFADIMQTLSAAGPLYYAQMT